MSIHRVSPCKINLILNVLGKREDGYHDLETVLYRVPICDDLTFVRGGTGIRLACNEPRLPVDDRNLVHRAASRFLEAAGIRDGVSIDLNKRVPMEGGLGGGSSNAGTTLRALNDLFDRPLDDAHLHTLAAGLGSDVPFFLQEQPALGTGRGDVIETLAPFPALEGLWILVVHPGFGVPTPWAYKQLSGFPHSLSGEPGRARRLIRHLQAGDLAAATPDFYNAFEAPVLTKYPLLVMIQEFFRGRQAVIAMLSGSGSAMFAAVRGRDAAARLRSDFTGEFGQLCWTEIAPLT